MEEGKIQLTLPKEEKEDISLTLHPEEKKEEKIEKSIEVVKMEDSLSKDELKQVEDFSKQIDIRETNVILQYGADAQKKIVEFSDTALNKVKTKDLGQIGDMLGGLVTELKGFNTEEDKGGFLGLFKKAGNRVAALKARYDSVEKNGLYNITGGFK